MCLTTFLKLLTALLLQHSIIGAVLGFGFVYGGAGAIVWNDKIDEFPYRKGCVTVFMSWFIGEWTTKSAQVRAAVLWMLVNHT